MPTDGENDYRNATLPELKDALGNIDAEAFPINFKNLSAEIQARIDGSHAEPPTADSTQERSVLMWMDLLMGAIIGFIGIYGLVRGEFVLPSRYDYNGIRLTGLAARVAGGGAIVVAVAIMSGGIDNSEPPRIGAGLRWTIRLAYLLVAIVVLWKGGASRT